MASFRETGIELLHSPYKGSAQAHTELLGGRIDLVADPFLSIIPFPEPSACRRGAMWSWAIFSAFQAKRPLPCR